MLERFFFFFFFERKDHSVFLTERVLSGWMVWWHVVGLDYLVWCFCRFAILVWTDWLFLGCNLLGLNWVVGMIDCVPGVTSG